MGPDGVLNAAVRDLANALNLPIGQAQTLVRHAAQNDISIFQAASALDLNLSNIDVGEFIQAFSNLPDNVRSTVLPSRSFDDLPAPIRQAVEQLPQTSPPPTHTAPPPTSAQSYIPSPASPLPPAPGGQIPPPPASPPGMLHGPSSAAVANLPTAPTLPNIPTLPGAPTLPNLLNLPGARSVLPNSTTPAMSTPQMPNYGSSGADLATRILSPLSILAPAQRPTETMQPNVVHPNNFLDRVFNGDGQRPGATQHATSATTPLVSTTSTSATATVTADAVRDPAGGLQVRGEGGQRNGLMSLLQGLVQGRGDGNAAPQTPAQQPLVQGRSDGHPNAAQSAAPAQVAANTLVQQTAPQQAPAFTGGQQQAMTQATDRAVMDSPLPQSARNDSSGSNGGLRAQDGAVIANAAADRGIATQQQLHAQQMPIAGNPQQGGPDAAAAQVPLQASAQTAATLASATMVINPQAHSMAQALNQNPAATPQGVDAAMSARDAQLAPAGHTLAGFLRRDQRGQQGMLQRAANRLTAMITGKHKRPTGSEPEVTSTQWLFWLLTIVAYGALGTAVMFLLPSGSRMFTDSGVPTAGGYALTLGILAAITSLIIGRKLFRR